MSELVSGYVRLGGSETLDETECASVLCPSETLSVNEKCKIGFCNRGFNMIGLSGLHIKIRWEHKMSSDERCATKSAIICIRKTNNHNQKWELYCSRTFRLAETTKSYAYIVNYDSYGESLWIRGFFEIELVITSLWLSDSVRKCN